MTDWIPPVLCVMRTIDQPSDCCFTLQINEVVKIQAFIRANKARDDYKTLSEYNKSNKTFVVLTPAPA